jgi:hypothetical protein
LQEAVEIKDKKLVGSLVFFLIIFTLTIPLLPSTVVKASPAVEIRDWHDLDAVRDNLSGSYVLMNDLNATTAGYVELASEAANEGKGWEPIGIYQQDEVFDPFTGTFDGQGYEIRDLFINRPDEDGVGLFLAVVAEGEGGVIKNVGVVNTRVTGGYMNVGGLAGFNAGNVSSCYCTGNVTGNWSVGGLVGLNTGNVSNSYSNASVTGVTGGWFAGGLVGQNMGGTVSNSYSSGSVTGDTMVGSLVGYNENGIVSNSYSNASMTGQQGVGGLVGGNDGGTVRNSYSSSSVTGDLYVGGLVGHNWNWNAIVGSCYSSGSVTGDSSVGGLVGYNDLYATVDESYAVGSVTGSSSVGGLVGYNRGTVSESYAVGSVTGSSSVGGLVGSNNDTVRNSFWDREASGMETSDAGVGKTTAEMMDITTFTDTKTEGLDAPWDMIAIAHGETNDAYAWNIVDGESYPFLSGKQFIAYTLTIPDTSGGRVITPGPGLYTYHAGETVDLVVEAEKHYRFVNWTGDVDTIANVTTAQTTITMNGNYSITANFEEIQSQTNWPAIGLIMAIGLIIAAVMLAGLFLPTHRRRKTR